MHDCPNVEMREHLPDLLHGRLGAEVRARVEAHVADCADCREELETLRLARHVLAHRRSAAIDAAAIVRALPRPVAIGSRAETRQRRRWSAWQIAAAVTLLALSGATIALLRGERDTAPPLATNPSMLADSGAFERAPGIHPSEVPAPQVVASADTPSARATRALGSEAALEDLADEELEALIGALDRLDATPLPSPDGLTGRRVVGDLSRGAE